MDPSQERMDAALEAENETSENNQSDTILGSNNEISLPCYATLVHKWPLEYSDSTFRRGSLRKAQTDIRHSVQMRFSGPSSLAVVQPSSQAGAEDDPHHMSTRHQGRKVPLTSFGSSTAAKQKAATTTTTKASYKQDIFLNGDFCRLTLVDLLNNKFDGDVIVVVPNGHKLVSSTILPCEGKENVDIRRAKLSGSSGSGPASTKDMKENSNNAATRAAAAADDQEYSHYVARGKLVQLPDLDHIDALMARGEPGDLAKQILNGTTTTKSYIKVKIKKGGGVIDKKVGPVVLHVTVADFLWSTSTFAVQIWGICRDRMKDVHQSVEQVCKRSLVDESTRNKMLAFLLNQFQGDLLSTSAVVSRYHFHALKVVERKIHDRNNHERKKKRERDEAATVAAAAAAAAALNMEKSSPKKKKATSTGGAATSSSKTPSLSVENKDTTATTGIMTDATQKGHPASSLLFSGGESSITIATLRTESNIPAVNAKQATVGLSWTLASGEAPYSPATTSLPKEEVPIDNVSLGRDSKKQESVTPSPYPGRGVLSNVNASSPSDAGSVTSYMLI